MELTTEVTLEAYLEHVVCGTFRRKLMDVVAAAPYIRKLTPGAARCPLYT